MLSKKTLIIKAFTEMNISLLANAHKECKASFEEAAIRSEPCLIHTIINYDLNSLDEW